MTLTRYYSLRYYIKHQKSFTFYYEKLYFTLDTLLHFSSLLHFAAIFTTFASVLHFAANYWILRSTVINLSSFSIAQCHRNTTGS